MAETIRETNLGETEMCPFCSIDGHESYAVYSQDHHQANGLFEEWVCPRCDAKTLIRADISEQALQALRDVVDCVEDMPANKEVEEDTDG